MPQTSGLAVGVVGALLLAGGFAAGYLVGAGRVAPAEPAAPAVERAGEPLATTSPPPLRAEPAAEPRLAGPTTAELEPLRRAIEALPPPEVPEGHGVITGRVLTKEGKPLAGVTITATPTMPLEMQAAARRDRILSPDLPTSVRDFVRRMRWNETARRQAVTGADGTYRLEGVLDAENRVGASLEGWQIRSTSRDPWRARPCTQIDFEATPRTEVRIQVYLPDGTQPEKAQISFRTSSMSWGTGWQRSEPAVEVDPGTWSVTASVGDEYRSRPVQVTVASGAPPPEVRLDLEGRVGIKGQVTFQDDQRTSGVQVRIARIPPGHAADPALLTAEVQTEHPDSLGGEPLAFSFLDLVPGRYLLGISRTWRGGIVATEEVEVTDRVVVVDLEVPALKREEYVILRVLDPDGQPLPDVNVSTGFRSKTGSSSGGSVVVKRPDGVLWVLHHAGFVDPEAEDARLWISVSDGRYGSRTLEYAPGTAPSLEVRFEEPATLDATIEGLVGSRYEGRIRAGLVVASQGGRWRGPHSGNEPDAQGRVAFGAVQPGRYVLELSIRAEPFGGSAIARKEVELSSGANTVRIAMPALYEVAVEGLTGPASVGAEGDDHSLRRTLTSGPEGRAILDGLTAGTYTVRSGQKGATFTVPGATTVRLE